MRRSDIEQVIALARGVIDLSDAVHEPGRCPVPDAGWMVTHCEHWYVDGGPCCWCGLSFDEFDDSGDVYCPALLP